ncbi:MAG: type I-F CRISPR-associated protein Csy3, partial [Methylococcaceae bacterium]|nr:type I-F CRISPR-associated protein Csy3 [Methylococcaceae bacterium]
MAKNELPTLLSFTRSIVPSNGVFYYVKDGKQYPILITEQTVRGTISNYSNVYSKTGEQDKADNIEKKLNPENANIQTIDICYLPPDIDSYHLDFSVSFLNKSLSPDSCNDSEFAQKIEAITKTYAENNGYLCLAKTYLTNLINGRWLWRNRYASDKQITLTLTDNQEYVFAVKDYAPQLDSQQQKAFDDIAQKIADAFTGASEPFRLNVSATGKIGNGQEVYPSQEFIEGKKGKFLAYNKIDQGKQAMMHSQKIGNAIRTIDTWYPNYDGQPLAIEPYGVMQQRAKAFRLPNTKTDLYSYLQNLADLQDSLNKANEPDTKLHYVIACLIR